jgi:hypothetical protein
MPYALPPGNAKRGGTGEKRQEPERLRIENATVQNKEYSKRKCRPRRSKRTRERRAEAERIERAERRARLGIAEPVIPASQSGNRRYARGRAYVEERFSNPETAEEKTLAASAESEFGDP